MCIRKGKDRQEEAHIILGLFASVLSDSDELRLQKELLRSVKKFAFKKYQAEFIETVRVIRDSLNKNPERFSRVLSGLDEIEHIASLRFQG